MTDNDKNDDRYTVPALARGLQLLMQFNRDERELSGAELSWGLSCWTGWS